MNPSTEQSPDGSVRALGAAAIAVVALVVWNLTRNSIPEGVLLWASVGFTVVLIVIGVVGGLGWSEFGLARVRVPAGLGYAALAVVLVFVGLFVGDRLPFTADHLADPRVRIGGHAMLFRVLVEIPVGTVLLEELAFRGVLLGLFRRLWCAVTAVVTSSVLFGMWHVNSVLHASHAGIGDALLAAVGTLVATTIAGIVFAWLRLRSGSLLAPIGAHIATNSVTFAFAWWVAR